MQRIEASREQVTLTDFKMLLANITKALAEQEALGNFSHPEYVKEMEKLANFVTSISRDAFIHLQELSSGNEGYLPISHQQLANVSNNLSMLVTVDIQSQKTEKEQGVIMDRWANILAFCWARGDLSSAMAISSGLNHALNNQASTLMSTEQKRIINTFSNEKYEYPSYGPMKNRVLVNEKPGVAIPHFGAFKSKIALNNQKIDFITDQIKSIFKKYNLGSDGEFIQNDAQAREISNELGNVNARIVSFQDKHQAIPPELENDKIRLRKAVEARHAVLLMEITMEKQDRADLVGLLSNAVLFKTDNNVIADFVQRQITAIQDRGENKDKVIAENVDISFLSKKSDRDGISAILQQEKDQRVMQNALIIISQLKSNATILLKNSNISPAWKAISTEILAEASILNQNRKMATLEECRAFGDAIRNLQKIEFPRQTTRSKKSLSHLFSKKSGQKALTETVDSSIKTNMMNGIEELTAVKKQADAKASELIKSVDRGINEINQIDFFSPLPAPGSTSSMSSSPHSTSSTMSASSAVSGSEEEKPATNVEHKTTFKNTDDSATYKREKLTKKAQPRAEYDKHKTKGEGSILNKNLIKRASNRRAIFEWLDDESTLSNTESPSTFSRRNTK